jgi:hypothetical protein
MKTAVNISWASDLRVFAKPGRQTSVEHNAVALDVLDPREQRLGLECPRLVGA